MSPRIARDPAVLVRGLRFVRAVRVLWVVSVGWLKQLALCFKRRSMLQTSMADEYLTLPIAE
ncbi:hypothetical protein [Paenibacillus phytorum]|nr:hypothetical protein [Paenibacillus phytorum]